MCNVSVCLCVVFMCMYVVCVLLYVCLCAYLCIYKLRAGDQQMNASVSNSMLLRASKQHLSDILLHISSLCKPWIREVLHSSECFQILIVIYILDMKNF